VVLCSYGDLLRVPGAQGDTLLQAKARGVDVRMVYSVSDALDIARAHPNQAIVFFAIGFETTTPPTAAAILQAKFEGLSNFSAYCNHVLTPPALRAIMATHCFSTSPESQIRLDGCIGPAHVSTIIGSTPYEFVATEYHRPLVIAGFEPLDVLHAILLLIRQINTGEAKIENEYNRAVSPEGNRKAQSIVAEVFTLRPSFEWRGLGELPNSALAIRHEYAEWDTERRFAVATIATADHKACACAEVLCGVKRPEECKAFVTACTPDRPLGSCMVSAEGACAAHYHYGRFRTSPLSAFV
jgi:hydrogenase expression/formation protein HypD